jgi:hypothetical protein
MTDVILVQYSEPRVLANPDGFQLCGVIPTQDLLPRLVTKVTAKIKPF